MSLANQEFLQAGTKMTRALTVEHFENVARFMNELKAIVVASKERQHFLKTGAEQGSEERKEVLLFMKKRED